ncbi:MAG TPA: hypothetical protein VMU54_22645, partial [Planctomycetota bacterium]|nr:hypothetical protein [Planctomycetota bacterium]
TVFDILDGLQLASSGLFGEEEYPAKGESLFQDVELKDASAKPLPQRLRHGDDEVSRLRGLVSELSNQIESLHRRLAQMEGQAAQSPAARPVLESIPTPSPPPPLASSAPVVGVPRPAEMDPAPGIPPDPAKKNFQTKTFKVVPAVKSFRVVDPTPAPPSIPKPPSRPAPQGFGAPPMSLPPLPPEKFGAPAASSTPLFAVPAAAPAPDPAPAPPPSLALAKPLFTPEAPEALNPPSSTAEPAPASAKWSPAVPGVPAAFAGPAAFGAPALPAGPSEPPPSQEALARLAKPEPAASTAAPRQRRGGKIFLMVGGLLVGGVLVSVLLFLSHPKDLKQMTTMDDGHARIGAEPAEDTAARAPRQSSPTAPEVPAQTDSAPVASSTSAIPLPEAGTAVQPAAQTPLDESVSFVKDYPLDGGRGTVAKWLQYSYSATPDAGQEIWNASQTAEKTYLVEYRFVPSVKGAPEVHYLFEADLGRGVVIGKTLDAKSMLAGGGPPPESARPGKPKTRPVSARKTAARRARGSSRSKNPSRGVPLLPLPSEKELHPRPADDGAFGPGV